MSTRSSAVLSRWDNLCANVYFDQAEHAKREAYNKKVAEEKEKEDAAEKKKEEETSNEINEQ